MKPLVRLLPSLLLLAPVLHAEEPVAGAVRSIVTTPAAPTERGTAALELGITQSFGKDRSREGGVTPQLDLGLTSWLDLRLGWTAQAWNRSEDGPSNRGAGDPYFTTQAIFARQGDAGLDIGAAYNHVFPRASVEKGLSSGYPDDTLLLTLSRGLGRWSLDANAGFNRTRVEDGSRNVSRKKGSFAVTYAPTSRWNLTLDTYGIAKSELGEREFGSILAVNYALSERLTVDMSVEHGWAEASPRVAINAGLIYQFGKIWGK